MAFCNKVETQRDQAPVLPKNLHEEMLAAAFPFLSSVDCNEEPIVLTSGNSSLVIKRGSVIIKAHCAKTKSSELNARLQLITHTLFRDLFIQPLRFKAELGGARLLTLWPAGAAAITDSPDEVNWERTAQLLASLHGINFTRTFAGISIPEAGWFSRLARSHCRLLATEDRPEKRTVLAAFATLPPVESKAWRKRGRSIIHGDWHPGQLVQIQNSFHFIDIDDIGLGDPSWDLARPAAWRMAGFLSDAVWSCFIGSYLEAGGSALDGHDPWASLELPARAAVIQAAANALANQELRSLENFELELVNLCSRIVKIFT